MTPIRLLAIIESRIISGPAKNLIDFVPLARSLGIETIVATFLRGESENFFTQSLKDLSIPVLGVSEEGPYDLSAIRKLKRLVSKVKPDLFQTHAVKSHFLTRLSGISPSIPWIAFHHGYTSTSWRTGLYNELDRWSLKAAAQVVTVSRASLEQLRTKGVDIKKIRVIHNAVPADCRGETVDTSHVRALRASLGIPAEQKVILSIGRLSKEKDQASLVDALSELRGSFSPHLVIVGDGPERKAIMERVRILGLTNRVTVTGLQDHVRHFYSLADVVVISSRSEGSPNVLLEALALGVPIIATAVGGIPEMVNHGEHALLVQHGNRRQMADSIARILAERDVAQSLVENGKMLVHTKFSTASRARTLSDMYKEILELNRQAQVRTAG
jgi:glycosyltransferase involved in cell wall biosynthesis